MELQLFKDQVQDGAGVYNAVVRGDLSYRSRGPVERCHRYYESFSSFLPRPFSLPFPRNLTTGQVRAKGEGRERGGVSIVSYHTGQ
jgi:hypothetical protein